MDGNSSTLLTFNQSLAKACCGCLLAVFEETIEGIESLIQEKGGSQLYCKYNRVSRKNYRGYRVDQSPMNVNFLPFVWCCNN